MDRTPVRRQLVSDIGPFRSKDKDKDPFRNNRLPTNGIDIDVRKQEVWYT